MIAPLVVLPHNFESNVQRVLTWRTDIIERRDGSEQRRRARVQPVEELTYAITVTSQEEAAQLARVLWNIPDLRIAFPRWEDAMPLGVAAVATDVLLTLVSPFGPRQFIDDALLYRGDTGAFERIAIDTTADPDLNLLNPLVDDWPAGSVVVPLVTGYVRSPVNGQDSGHLIGQVPLTIEVEEDVAGITSGGDDVPMVPVTIDVFPHAPGSESYIAYGDVQGLIVEVKDAGGALIPNPDLTWDTLGSGELTVYPTGMPSVINVKNNRSSPMAGPVDVSITFTCDTVVFTYDVTLE